MPWVPEFTTSDGQTTGGYEVTLISCPDCNTLIAESALKFHHKTGPSGGNCPGQTA